jgi:hypothetical protein
LGEFETAKGEQVAQCGAQLIRSRASHGREAPALAEFSVDDGPEMGLCVTDIDDEQHGWELCGPRERGARQPHTLVESERCERVGKALAVGGCKAKVELE